MMIVYLASPIDGLDANEREKVTAARITVRSVLAEEGITVYDPASAWTTKRVDPRLGQANQRALESADGLIALWLSLWPSIGVPFELGWMLGRDRPVVAVTDEAERLELFGIPALADPTEAAARMVAVLSAPKEGRLPSDDTLHDLVSRPKLDLVALGLDVLIDRVGVYMEAKGWTTNGSSSRTLGELIALCHSELSEALEEHRAGRDDLWFDDTKPEGVAVELADCIIRIAGLCYEGKIDLSTAMRIKLDYNDTRPHRHGGKLI